MKEVVRVVRDRRDEKERQRQNAGGRGERLVRRGGEQEDLRCQECLNKNSTNTQNQNMEEAKCCRQTDMMGTQRRGRGGDSGTVTWWGQIGD